MDNCGLKCDMEIGDGLDEQNSQSVDELKSAATLVTLSEPMIVQHTGKEH